MKIPNRFLEIDGEEAYRRILESDNSNKKENSKPVIILSSDFSIQDKSDFYSINGVKLDDGIYSVDLSKRLLPSRTQDEHAEARRKAGPDEFYLGDISLYHALFTSLFENKESGFKNEIENARQFLKKSMLEHWLTTLTRIQYNSGVDRVIHNYKQPNQDSDDINNFTGPDGYITKVSNTEIPLQLLLSTSQNVNEINEVYNWLTDVNAYIWRINSTPNDTVEKVAWLRANSDRADLGCYRDPSNSNGGLGVRAKILRK
jgi:hypothetical protein